MTDFLIKSTVSMLAFLAIYQLFLEKEKMHRFNRFYLLFALAFSLVLPFISFTIYKEVAAEPLPALPDDINLTTTATPFAEPVDYTTPILWSLYGVITLLLAIRFAKNIRHFIKQVKSNISQPYENATLVLVKEKVLPHTFLNYVFVSKEEYEHNTIEYELYTHELTHVKQKHSLDILFIEVLKTIFWFNPLLYMYKKAIQLNHEFLADESVVDHNNVTNYQKLLLQKAVPATTYRLASNLNFSVTKKRFKMMTKATPKRKALLLKLAALPVIAGLVYALCTETVAQTIVSKEIEVEAIAIDNQVTNNHEKDAKQDSYFAGVRIKVMKKAHKTKKGFVGGDVIMDKLYEELTTDEKEKYKMWFYIPKPPVKKSPTSKEIEEYKNSKKYAIWIDGKNVANSELSKYKPQDIAYFSGSVILKNARTKKQPQTFQYWFYTHNYFDKNEMEKEKTKYSGDTIEIFEDYTDIRENKESKTVNQTIDTIKKSREQQIAEAQTRRTAVMAERAKVMIKREEMAAQRNTMAAGRDVMTAQRDSLKAYKNLSVEGRLKAIESMRELRKIRREEIAAKKAGIKTEAIYQEDKIYSGSEVTVQPEYPGGIPEFYTFVNKNFKIPEKLNGSVKIYVSFVVEKDGSLSNMKILRDPGYGAGEETLRVLKESKKWNPGKIDTKNVRTSYSLPILLNVK